MCTAVCGAVAGSSCQMRVGAAAECCHQMCGYVCFVAWVLVPLRVPLLWCCPQISCVFWGPCWRIFYLFVSHILPALFTRLTALQCATGSVACKKMIFKTLRRQKNHMQPVSVWVFTVVQRVLALLHCDSFFGYCVIWSLGQAAVTSNSLQGAGTEMIGWFRGL